MSFKVLAVIVSLAVFGAGSLVAAPKSKGKTHAAKKHKAAKADKKSRLPTSAASEAKTSKTPPAEETKAVNVPEASPTQSEESTTRPAVEDQLGASGGAATSAYIGKMHYRYRMSAQTGINILSGQGSGYLMGGQFGFAPASGTAFYLGPEVDFSLFSPGSMLQVMAAAWYEVRVYGAPRLSLSLGGAIGPAFATSLREISSTTLGGYLEACIAQDVNDLATLRSQFRPGFVGGYFSFMMNFSVQFRFL